MISETTFKFLRMLAKNNNREWFNDNKESFKQALGDFEALVAKLLSEIQVFDPALREATPKDFIFRIYRDVRFAKDKSPYKTHFGAFMTPGGRSKAFAGYYIHIEAGDKSMYAGGIHQPPTPVLNRIRDHVAENGKTLREILKNPNFKKIFPQLWGDQLKTVPRGFSKDHENAEFLKYKSFIVTREVVDKQVLAKGFTGEVIKGFKTVVPLNHFLNATL